jgi:hypothetical protein
VHPSRTRTVVGAALVGLLLLPLTGGADSDASVATPSANPKREWWAPGSGKPFPAEVRYPNEHGEIGILNLSSVTDTKGHPFFEPFGTTGRACVTCHQPADAMSLSLESIRQRWEETRGGDPLFDTFDGANCPHLPRGERKSHSLLLDRGLIRIALPWPGKDFYGNPIEPEFTIKVISDPTGCNTHPKYGLNSKNPTISVYRRPRMAANLRYSIDERDDFLNAVFTVKTGMPFPKDPETGKRINLNLMFDGREPNLKMQALNAGLGHMQMLSKFTDEELKRIVDFESQIYAAQAWSKLAGSLDADGVPKGLGPKRLSTAYASLPGDNLTTPTFQRFDEWKAPMFKSDGSEADEFRASVARGADLFMTKPMWIRDVWTLTNGGSGNPMKRTCSTCHNSQMSGLDNSPGWFGLGMSTPPWADAHPDMPLFELRCHKDAVPHPYEGRVIRTHDPGRALISGKCVDIGALTVHQSRGMAARAPYFSNGSAKDLAGVLEFYERRFNFKYTPQEKQDLINFLSVL